LIVSWCAGGRCGMAYSDEDRGSSRRPSAEDRRWSHRSGTRWPADRQVGWHCVRSGPCTWRRGVRVSWLGLKTKVDGLSVVWPQNHWDIFLQFDLKTGGDGFFGLATKPVAVVSWFSLKTKVVEGFPVWASKLRLRFGDLGLKITATVSWFVPQNQAGFDLSVAPQNRWREVSVVYASRSSGLLHVEASLARVSQSGLKTDRGAMAGGARGTIMEVASELS
jgi:hypothetical protein